jgi:molybdate transport system substrate-binding protein
MIINPWAHGMGCLGVKFSLLWCGTLVCTVMGRVAQADDVHVAVAANFLATCQQVAEGFSRQGRHRVIISSGSTGKLYAQIVQGAPYEIFLAADAERPQRLEREGYGVKDSRYTYARGRLALWSRDARRVDAEGNILQAVATGHLAMANPRTAPYGVAAKQTLEHLGVWQAWQPRIVQGEDIGQVLQFVDSGAAELGFVAHAQVKQRAVGSYWLVPPSLHAPLEQQAVLLLPGSDAPGALAFMGYLRSAEARRLIQDAGYDVP